MRSTSRPEFRKRSRCTPVRRQVGPNRGVLVGKSDTIPTLSMRIFPGKKVQGLNIFRKIIISLILVSISVISVKIKVIFSITNNSIR